MKLVLTGAAGRLGSYLREPLAKMADQLTSTDIVPDIGKLYAGERYMRADLADLSAVQEVLNGADMVVHFGAVGDEAPFDQILSANIVGAYNIWEAAYIKGLKRVVYASSIHAVGMHANADKIDTDAPHRPDTYYGLAKCFAEDLGRMYWDKRQLEATCLRIFSCAQVTSPRSLATWLSYDDLIQLVTQAINTPDTGFHVVYGVSNNDRSPLDNADAAAKIGYVPKDNAEVFAEEILANAEPVGAKDLAQTRLGGPFAIVPLGQSGLATMKIVDDRKKT